MIIKKLFLLIILTTSINIFCSENSEDLEDPNNLQCFCPNEKKSIMLLATSVTSFTGCIVSALLLNKLEIKIFFTLSFYITASVSTGCLLKNYCCGDKETNYHLEEIYNHGGSNSEETDNS